MMSFGSPRVGIFARAALVSLGLLVISLACIGLGAYMAELADQKAPKGKVVMHHWVGLQVAILATEAIDRLLTPKHGRANATPKLTAGLPVEGPPDPGRGPGEGFANRSLTPSH
jgi:hypothetical protein